MIQPTQHILIMFLTVNKDVLTMLMASLARDASDLGQDWKNPLVRSLCCRTSRNLDYFQCKLLNLSIHMVM